MKERMLIVRPSLAISAMLPLLPHAIFLPYPLEMSVASIRQSPTH